MNAEKRPLRAEDLLNFACVGDPQLSPDGRNLAYVKQTFDENTHESKTDIFLMDIIKGTTKKLTNSGKDSSPRWSPAGERLAFISSRSGKPQIWIIDISGGEAWHLDTNERVLGEPRWSFDGTRIFFTANSFSKPDGWVPYPGSPESDRQRAEKEAERSLHPEIGKESGNKKDNDDRKRNEAKVITRLRYRRDGTGYFGDLRRQVFYVNVPRNPSTEKGLNAIEVTHGDFDHSAPEPSPDGRWIVVTAYRSGDADYQTKDELWLFDLETKETHLLYRAPGPMWSLKWSPDGSMIAFYGHDNSHNVSTRTDLFVVSLDKDFLRLQMDERPKQLSPEKIQNLTGNLDLHAGELASSDISYRGGSILHWENKNLYFAVADGGASYVYRAHLSHGYWSLSRLCGSEREALSAFSVSGNKIVLKISTPISPENLFLAESKDFEPVITYKQLTFENSALISKIKMGTWDKFTYTATDGQRLDGWLIYPAGCDPAQVNEHPNKYSFPLVVPVHGGPHGIYGSAFMFHAQLFAGHGYAVCYFNPRGSSSYGQRFMSFIDGQWGRKDYGDLMAGVDEVVSKGFIDQSNMFIHGWSYGGYMTAWVITQTSRFKAACAGAPVTDMYSGYGTSDILLADEHEFGGRPWENPGDLIRSSPLNYVKATTTPVLLLHGENDLRCPVIHTEEFYTALRRLGKTAVMVRYPAEPHGLKKPIHRIDRHTRLLAWFEYYRLQK